MQEATTGDVDTRSDSVPSESVRNNAFHGVLFCEPADRQRAETAQPPDFFRDLNLDQVVEAITAGRAEYDLAPFFYTPLTSVAAVTYRHDVLRDLEQAPVAETVRTFGRSMQAMRKKRTQAGKLHYRRQKQFWFLDAVWAYCSAVTELSDDLADRTLGSAGLRGLRDHVDGYAAGQPFRTLVDEAGTLRQELADVRYRVRVRGPRVTVGDYDGEPDYSADVEATFAKFRQGDVEDHRVAFREYVEMNHVEAQILDLVAKLNPELFGSLNRFCAEHAEFVDDSIRDFDREVQFYLAYLDFLAPLASAGLRFCYPHLSDSSKDTRADDTFDLALANKLVPEGHEVVVNEFHLTGAERMIVVSGPNQGGKTTFARTFAQLHYLARLGCLVAGRHAELFLCDRVLTHFEKQEDVGNLAGKLHDDLLRIRDILAQASGDSVLVLNEMFTSTTLDDAVFLGSQVLQRVADLGALCVCVTFVDELASLTDSTVSMMSTVVPDNPAQRTLQVVRQPADGLSYAAAIAEKHGLSYARLKSRLAR